ncbi:MULTISPECIES: low affinity iron permease family protein [unclassified Actinoplanes]|uniref:low affinity iron permease family protein n=1 Tax=unclassified Actinoplanes TaxID=2626549 RepID=UPI0003074B41|nr:MULTISPECIES: low affinity iron permease family protein [unclassified Actinoplanes]
MKPTLEPSGSGVDDHQRAVALAHRTRRRYWRQRALSSRLLHRLGELSAHSLAGLAVAGLVVAWLIIGVVISFPGWWENALYVTSSLITLTMVFTVQHTQARQAVALQRKLDELLRAVPAADNRLIALEEVPERELQELHHRDIASRENTPEAQWP